MIDTTLEKYMDYEFNHSTITRADQSIHLYPWDNYHPLSGNHWLPHPTLATTLARLGQDRFTHSISLVDVSNLSRLYRLQPQASDSLCRIIGFFGIKRVSFDYTDPTRRPAWYRTNKKSRASVTRVWKSGE